jgi:hypothetical protein
MEAAGGLGADGGQSSVAEADDIAFAQHVAGGAVGVEDAADAIDQHDGQIDQVQCLQEKIERDLAGQIIGRGWAGTIELMRSETGSHGKPASYRFGERL